MAFNKKYAGLPDLDLAPDVYETPDLTDEASTVPTATIRTTSNADDDAGSDSDIDRHPVNADEARAHFLGATVDARDVNFSDSIAIKRKSYRSKSRRRRKDLAGEGEDSDSETESLERKLARLRREVEELKDEMTASEKAADAESNGAQVQPKESINDGVEELSRALDNLYASSRGASQPHSAAALLSQKLVSGTQIQGSVPQNKDAPIEAETTASPSGLLSHVADFDARLSLIESAMGISTSLNPFISDGTSETPLQPVLPALDHLTTRLSTLMNLLVGPSPVSAVSTTGTAPSSTTTTAITTPHLEMLLTRVKKLTAEAEALASARRRALDAAKAAQTTRFARAATSTMEFPVDFSLATSTSIANPNPSSTSPVTPTAGGTTTEPANPDHQLATAHHNEQATKIQALYSTLPTIQSLHPILPSVLERLRSLRAIHAGAAQAAESLDELEKHQADMAAEIEQWRAGLKAVEEKMAEGEKALKGNVELVEPWVRDLEKRLEGLEVQR